VLLYTMLGDSTPLTRTYKQEIVDQYDNFQPVVETYISSLPGQATYTQIIRWVQLRCNAYWSAVVCTVTGVVRAPAFLVLFNIQYKQWNRPSIPWKYLAAKQPKAPAPGTSSLGDQGSRGAAGSRNQPPTSQGGELVAELLLMNHSACGTSSSWKISAL
jgi:hypothetical protein